MYAAILLGYRSQPARSTICTTRFFYSTNQKLVALVNFGWYLLVTSSSTHYRQTFGPRRERPEYLHVATGAVVTFSVYPLLHGVLEGSTLVSIMIFSLLSVLLTFPLRGPLWCKMLWLGLGNLVGLAWNLIWLSLISLTAGIGVFQIVHFAIGPAVSFMWIVPVWSLGFSALASVEHRERGEKRKETK